MKLLQFSTLVAIAVAGVFALPAESQAKDHKITVFRDNDHDGHYNKKTIEVRGRDHHDYDRYSYHGGHYYGGRSYYGSRYSGYPYRYGYGYPYYGPSVGVSYYSSPSYTYSRSYGYDDDTAVDVQRALKRRGYYRGTIDGDIGPGTRSAIRAYQADRRLPVTGRIDGSLLRSLGV
jgi:hypothetical protein